MPGALRVCPECGTRVFPMADGTCPACRKRSFPQRVGPAPVPSQGDIPGSGAESPTLTATAGPRPVPQRPAGDRREPARPSPAVGRTTQPTNGDNQGLLWALSALAYFVCTFVLGVGCAVTHWELKVLLGVCCLAVPLWLAVSLFLDLRSFLTTAISWFCLAAVPALGLGAGLVTAELRTESGQGMDVTFYGGVLLWSVVFGAVAALLSVPAVTAGRQIVHQAKGAIGVSPFGDSSFRLVWSAVALAAVPVSVLLVVIQHKTHAQAALIDPSSMYEYAALADQLNRLTRQLAAVDALAGLLLLAAVALLTVAGILARRRLLAGEEK